MPEISKDLRFMDHDRYVINAIAMISKEKNLAVQEENYTLAKTMKGLQEAFSKVATDLSHLSNEKRTAIAVEDYDRAESLQFEIQNKKNLVVSKLHEHGYRIDAQDSKLHKNSGPTMKNNPLVSASDTTNDFETLEESINGNLYRSRDAQERPQSARDPSTPTELSDEDMQKYALPVDAFGTRIVGCVLSPYFNLREKGINEIKNELQNDNIKSPELLCKATFQILNFVGTDIREKANALFCELYRTLLGAADGFPTILNKIGDLNPRIKERSLELVVTICDFYHAVPNTVLPFLVKPFNATKIQSIPWKHIKARLDLTAQMIREYGMAESGSNASGLNMNNVTSFTVQFLEHTNAQVRESAFTVLCGISLCEGQQAVLDSIPNLSPAQIQTLQKRLPGETRPATAFKSNNASSLNLRAQTQTIAQLSEFSIKDIEKSKASPKSNHTNKDLKKGKSKGLFSFFGHKEGKPEFIQIRNQSPTQALLQR
ncbi:hypothetical protein HDV01_000155 [Terramyces sp. JEL0728]|nr:hypothetical protein HDV01_000155 [Terramyces sp. JEL0728]